MRRILPAAAALFILQVLVQETAAVWSSWSDPSTCSQTCGVGVAYQTRSCLEGKCSGANRRYSTCNLQPCPKGSLGIREALCSAFNNITLGPEHFEWIPHNDKENECALTCKDKKSGEVYTLQEEVEDGTPCGPQASEGVCLANTCQKVGCDGHLSGKRVDKCGKCGGDGSSCYTIRRTYSLVNHFTGYNDIFEIPVGATNIMVTERHHGRHYLALRNQKGKYFLNGDWKIVKSTDVKLAGTTFSYHQPANASEEAETLISKGPTHERIMLTLLYQDPDPDVKVDYEYSLPLDADLAPPQDTPVEESKYLEIVAKDSAPTSQNNVIKSEGSRYTWISGPWTKCSENCDGGHQTRHVKCLQKGSNKVVGREFCQRPSKPAHRQKCNTQPCEAGCISSPYGCCPDGETPAAAPNGGGCSQPLTDTQSSSCQGWKYGCCEDGVSFAAGPNQEGCPRKAGHKSCYSSPFGCCSDGKTPATGKHQQGCPLNADVCLEPKKKGKCRAKLVRWYFDHKSKSCLKFHYGGCRGNRNRFESKLSCEMNCRSLMNARLSELSDRDVCSLPRDERQCKEAVISWYFDSDNGTCERYWFGGCAKKGNHFDTEEACVSTCKYHSFRQPRTTAISGLALCQLPSDPGPCSDGQRRWYYDVIRAECLTFAYGGCKGNANNFKSLSECLRQCVPGGEFHEQKGDNSERSVGYPAVCLRPKEEGLCSGSDWESKWYFNSQEEQCEEFWFGGCDEDDVNVFGSEEECRTTCRKQHVSAKSGRSKVNGECSLSLDLSTCGEKTTKWYFDARQQKCRTFLWGGCDPKSSANRFDSEEECRRKCSAQSDSPRRGRRRRKNRKSKKRENVTSDRNVKCGGKPDGRMCGKPTLRWFYNQQKGVCEQFWYGGCDGSPENLYTWEVDCMRECRGYRTRTTATGRRGPTSGDPRAETCGVAPDRRICKSGVVRWFYDLEQGHCRQFTFGQCSVGGNAFSSKVECERNCRGFSYAPRPESPEDTHVTARASQTQGIVSDVCFEDKVERFCGKWTTMWYFNRHTNMCETFSHGGCGTGGNQFVSKEECAKKCKVGYMSTSQRPVPAQRPPAARKPAILPVSGFRLGSDRPRDWTWKTNDQAQCSQPQDDEVCGEYTQKWRYDAGTGRCKSFWHGGCRNKGNAFDSQNECRRQCEGRLVGVAPRRTTPTPRRLPDLPHGIYQDPDRSPDVCQQDKNERYCGKWLRKWFYNRETGRCKDFYHGGCNAGGNQFDSELECRRKCEGSRRVDYRTTQAPRRTQAPSGSGNRYPVSCTAPKDVRKCGEWRNRWFYDTETRSCKQFWHGNCGDGGNQFASQDSCRRACEGKGLGPSPGFKRPPHSQDVCLLDRNEDICGEWENMWYYDREKRACKPFFFGGCGMNGNKFATEAECRETCVTSGFIRPTIRYPWPRDAICLEEKNQRYCGKWSHRWYFNKLKHQCEKFLHGGCGSGGNQFDTLHQCRQKCASRPASYFQTARRRSYWQPTRTPPYWRLPRTQERCFKPKNEGVCRAPRSFRWYYNLRTGSCERFYDGGCDDDGNVFVSADECRRLCSGQRDVDRPLPTIRPRPTSTPDRGNRISDRCLEAENTHYCGSWNSRWYYNKENGKCEDFLHGGCGTGGNLFFTRHECERLCEGRTKHVGNPKRTPDRCVDRNEAIICDLTGVRWFYNRETRRCQHMELGGGCHSTTNKFRSRSECMRVCERREPGIYVPRTTLTPYNPVDDRCVDKNEAMMCDLTGVRWFYNRRTRRCQHMELGGGCHSTTNKFCSRAECITVCEGRSPGIVPGTTISPNRPIDDRCVDRNEAILCDLTGVRWFYNRETRRCQHMELGGGCHSTTNKFRSRSECMRVCERREPGITAVTPYRPADDRCLEEKNTTYCGGWSIRWYFNRYTRHCEDFVHGRCTTGGNLFTSQDECHTACARWVDPAHRQTPERYRYDYYYRTTASDRCLMEKYDRYCGTRQLRWFYNQRTRRCEDFQDGGCGVHGNIFTSKYECQRICEGRVRDRGPVTSRPYVPTGDRNDDRCLADRNTEICGRLRTRWFYDRHTRRCEQYQDGGCRSGGNQFVSRYECQRTCLRQYPNPVTRRPWTDSGEVCLQDKDVRICGQCGTKWYYNADEQRCERFLYCGCSSSDNKFNSFSECERTCAGRNRYVTPSPTRRPVYTLPTLPPRPDRDICRLPKKVGPCYGSFSQWYYDAAYGSCLEFIYGGCDGNENNFDTEEECVLRCDSDGLTRRPAPTPNVCDDQRVDSRKCSKDWQNRYRYNSETGRCEQFWHGGCRDDGNVFKDEIECRRTCQGVRRTTNRPRRDVCLEPRDDSRCGGERVRWYYELSSGRCFKFRYRGCTEGGNQFRSEEECRRKCHQYRDGNIAVYPTRRPRPPVYPTRRPRPPVYPTRRPPVYPTRRPRPQVYPTRRPPVYPTRRPPVYPTRRPPVYPTRRPRPPVYPTRRLPVYPTRRPPIYPTRRPQIQVYPNGRPQPTWQPPVSDGGDECGMDADPGDCKAFVKRWYYHYLEGDCFQFNYGGCGGNANNFKTQRECARACLQGVGPPEINTRPTRDRGSDVCDDQRVDSRKCSKDWQNRYRYNSETGRCEQFWHGGCRDDGNVFKDEIECRRTCQGRGRTVTDTSDRFRNTDVCLLPREKGPCRARKLRWHFDESTGECRQFNYGGCQGNANRFDTKQECIRTCHHRLRSSNRVLYLDSPDMGDVCLMAQDDTLCTNWTSQWRYNQTAGQCQQFWDGGCDRVANRFESQEACWTTCYEYASRPQPEPEAETGSVEEEPTPEPEVTPHPSYHRPQPSDICMLPKDERECAEMIVKWFYNSQDGKCERFWYGGCNDAGNQFDSQADCEKMCHQHGDSGDRIHVDPAVDSPPDDYPRNPDDMQDPYYPETRVVVGPSEEDNVNEPQVDPQTVPYNPDPQPAEDLCHMPVETGPCKGSFPRWYYDVDLGKCKRFIFGGCQGNGNNFEDKKSCRRLCSPSKLRKHKKPVPEEPTGEDPSQDNTIPANPDVCRMLRDDRFCGDWVNRWFYNQTSQACEATWLGSCGEGGNQFATEEDCSRLCANTPPIGEPDIRDHNDIFVDNRVPPAVDNMPAVYPDADICSLHPEAGPCRDDIVIRWFYDPESQRCDRFRYGGCEGNGNRFETEEDCERACRGHGGVITLPEIPEDVDICSLHPEAGPCRDDLVIRWFYDPESQRCDRFRYGGCEGNGNRFETEEDCRLRCPHGHRPANRPDPQDVDICSLHPEAGPCRDDIVIRWFYDPESQRCDRFRYGGCEGNGNRFETEEDCRRRCERQDGQDTLVTVGPAVYVTHGPRRRVTFRPRLPDIPDNPQCSGTEFGCCPDGNTVAGDANFNTCPASAPEILPLGRDVVVVRSGDDVTIPCDVRGAPKPTIVWHQDGVRIPPDSNMFILDVNGALTVTSVKRKDSGQYTCTADNGAEFTASQTVSLVVQESPVIDRTMPSNVVTPPGHTANLHCLATGNPRPELSWLDQEGRQMYNTTRVSVFPNGTLVISPTEPADAGTYTCVARSGVAESVRKMVTLDLREGVSARIKSHDIMYFEGDELKLTCEVSGYPYPSVTWLKDDLPVNTSHKVRLHHRGEKLTVHNLEIADAGLYQCKISNGQAEDLASTLVRVDLRDITDGECTDPRGKVYCRIIVAASMCHRRHFARLCCESCRAWLQNP